MIEQSFFLGRERNYTAEKRSTKGQSVDVGPLLKKINGVRVWKSRSHSHPVSGQGVSPGSMNRNFITATLPHLLLRGLLKIYMTAAGEGENNNSGNADVCHHVFGWTLIIIVHYSCICLCGRKRNETK